MPRSALLVAAILALPASPASAQVDSLGLARQYTQWFFTGQLDSLWNHTSAGMRQQMGSTAVYRERLDQLVSGAGSETAVLGERFIMRSGKPQYWREANYSGFGEPLLFRWVIVNGEIDGMGMGPASQAPPIDPPRP
jgi:hypothetical protein